MFDTSIDVDKGGKGRRLCSMLGSLLIQLALVTLVIVLPLVFTDTLSLAKILETPISAPLPPRAPVPTKSMPSQPRSKPVETREFVFRAPSSIPKGTPQVVDDLPTIELSEEVGVTVGIPGGLENVGGVTLGVGPNLPQPPSVPPQAVKEQPKEIKVETPKVVKVGGDIQAGKLVTKVVPIYPQMAKQIHIQGTVRLSATIGKSGAVENLTVVSGHPMLVTAAVDAVKRWVYRPTMLNNEPVSVLTTIEVNFTLTQ